MHDIESQLKRWEAAGLLDAVTAARIRSHELALEYKTRTADDGGAGSKKAARISWQGVTALILGAILLACGVVLFVSAHWDEMGPGARFALVLAMVAVFHVAGGLTRDKYYGLGTALHSVGTIATGAAIALTGQIFNINEHWPAAVLMWAIAALAGWALLRDQAQQTLALLLVPAWMLSEFGYHADRHIGEWTYEGRILFVWAVLYLTFFVGSRRKVVQGILFAVSVVASITGVVLMLENWTSFTSDQTFLPWGLRVWAWIAIAAVPLVVAAFHGHKGLIPIAAAIGLTIALPWSYILKTDSYNYGHGNTYTWHHTIPSLAAHALVAGFAVFLSWWGVRIGSRLLVNFGIVGFAITVAWFYFSDIMDKFGRSLGLIGLGTLFLAGGWALEKLRRRIVAGMRKDGGVSGVGFPPGSPSARDPGHPV
ncbi:MAG: DUF2157 domain-containing protein [Terracidiphilus sp.]